MTASRRILHVTDCYSTGVGRAIDTIVALTPQHEHHLLFAGDEDPTGRGFAGVTALPASTAARIAAVRDVARSAAADLVHAHSSRGGVYARARALPVPVVYEPHAYKLLDPALPRPARAAIGLAERLLGRRTEGVVVLSAEEAKVAARLTPRARRVLLPNAPSLAGLPRPAEHAQRPRTVVMSGRVCPQKDPGYFAETAAHLRDQDPSVTVRWVGSPDDPALGERLADAGVTVTGWLGPQALAEELTAAGVYLHTAVYEGFPISVLDAAWCRAPVLVRDIPAFAGTGLTRVGAPADAAAQIVRVLDEPAARERALAASEDLLTQMNEEVQRERLRDLYG